MGVTRAGPARHPPGQLPPPGQRARRRPRAHTRGHKDPRAHARPLYPGGSVRLGCTHTVHMHTPRTPGHTGPSGPPGQGPPEAHTCVHRLTSTHTQIAGPPRSARRPDTAHPPLAPTASPRLHATPSERDWRRAGRTAAGLPGGGPPGRSPRAPRSGARPAAPAVPHACPVPARSARSAPHSLSAPMRLRLRLWARLPVRPRRCRRGRGGGGRGGAGGRWC